MGVSEVRHLPVQVETFPVGFFQTNVYLVVEPSSGEALVVDPGGGLPEIRERVRAQGLSVRALVATHAHVDHVLDADLFAEWADVPLLLHPADRILLEQRETQLRSFGFPVPRALRIPPVEALQEGVTLTLGRVVLEVWHTPGHSPGHVVLVEKARTFALVGDLIFRGSIGRVDLPGGDAVQMQRSLLRFLQELPDTIWLFPGHGPVTTLGDERVHNPFLREGGIA